MPVKRPPVVIIYFYPIKRGTQSAKVLIIQEVCTMR